MIEQEGTSKTEQTTVETGLDRREIIKVALGAATVAAVGSKLVGTAAAQGLPPSHSHLAHAVLKEIPLSQVEIHLQTLNSGLLRGKSPTSKGDWCGGGCNTTTGNVCGIFCFAD